MATHDYVIDNSTGANVRSDLNNVLQAILTNNSSGSSPGTTAAYMFWADTSNNILKLRNSNNTDWIPLLQLDGTYTIENGSNSAPGLAFREQLNTGIFRTSNSLGISSEGTTRALFDSNGLTITSAATISGTGNASLILDCGTGSASGDQVSFIDFKINGTVKSNIAVNEAASTNKLELASAGNASVHAFFDNSLKLNTQSTGVKVLSTLQVGDDGGSIVIANGSGFSPTFTENAGDLEYRSNNSKRFTFTNGGDINLENNRKLAFGGSNQALQLYHDGSNAYIDVGTGAGVLHLRSKDDIKLQTDMSDLAVKCDANQQVELYFDGGKQFETTSVGNQLKGQTRFATSGGTFCALTEVFKNTSHTAGGSLSFQTVNGHGGGTVTVTLTVNGNAAVKTTKMFGIALRSTSNSGLTSEIFSINSGTGVNFTVTGSSQGVTVANNSSSACTCTVRFDMSGSL